MMPMITVVTCQEAPTKSVNTEGKNLSRVLQKFTELKTKIRVWQYSGAEICRAETLERWQVHRKDLQKFT